MAFTQYYVDPSIAADSGTGTIGDPYGDLQYALNNITRDAVNGDQVNVKAGTAEVLTAALTLASYGTPSLAVPLIIRGYASAANDGDFEAKTGMGEVDCNGAASFWVATGNTGVFAVHMKIHNTTGYGWNSTAYMPIIQCEVYDSAIFLRNNAFAYECHVYHVNQTLGINTNVASYIVGCFVESGSGSTYWSTGGVGGGGGATYFVMDTIIYMKSGHTVTANGISGGLVTTVNVSVFAENSASGDGIDISINSGFHVADDIEGHSGTGAWAIGGASARPCNLLTYNAEHDNTNDYNLTTFCSDDNETLSGTGFDKSGAVSFANRMTYFAPADSGNVLDATKMGLDKGAVQSSAPGVLPNELLFGGMDMKTNPMPKQWRAVPYQS
jgi:hypothetical protein